MSFKSKILLTVFLSLIAWYFFDIFLHFLSARPLWNDEQCVFESVQSFTVKEMFGRPLLALQVFPRVHLFLIQCLASPFGYSSLSLRFMSLLAMIAGFFIWIKIYRREIVCERVFLLAVFSWVASGRLIYYAAELKPYAMDVLIVGVLIAFLIHQRDLAQKLEPGKYLLLSSCLPLLGFFSYPAFFILLLPLYNMIVSRFLERKTRREQADLNRQILCYIASLLIVAALFYQIDMKYRHKQAVTDGYWDYFISLQSAGEFFKTWGEGTINLFTRWFAENPRWVRKWASFFNGFGLIYMFILFFNHFKKERFYLGTLKTISFAVYCQMVVLGALRMYPFTVPRISLFFAPFVIYLTVEALVATRKIYRFIPFILCPMYVIYLFIVAIGLTQAVFLVQLGTDPHIFP